ncbi:MAG TPA: glycosyltransferase family 39 protein [Thermodesulfobacteriota bacterium]|nr:glycosyltransferase family 39 protein [Thermodesulfobacteriota bacterium]
MRKIKLNSLSLFFSSHNNFDLEKICLPLLLVISFVAIFFQLGSRSFENQCYIRYAEVAREMIRSGDWIVPRLEGELFLHKPALLIWLIALPSALVGKVTPLLARLPSALSAVAIIGLTYFLGKRMFRDFRVGALAGLILLSSKEFFWQARTARADMALTLFILFSLTCFFLAYESSGKKRFFLFILFSVGMALGTLTKGPAVILFYLGPVTLFLFFKKRLRVLFEPGFWWGWFLFALILLSWILPYLSRVAVSTVLEQFSLSKILSRPEPFYYYLVEFWPRFAPWSLFLPAAVVFFFRQNPDQRDEKLFLLSWIVIIIAFISLIQNKTYRYLLPIFPAYSIILGAAFKEGFLSAVSRQDWIGRFWEYPVRFYLFVFLITFLPAPFLAWWFTRSATVALVSMVIFLGGSILIGYAIFRGKALAKVVVIGLCSLLIYETYYYFISFEDKKHSPFMQVAESVKARTDPEALCFFDFAGEKAILIDFYLDTVAPKFSGASEVVNFLTKNNEPHACLTSQQGFTQISQDLSPKSLEVYPLTYYKKATYYLIISKRE